MCAVADQQRGEARAEIAADVAAEAVERGDITAEQGDLMRDYMAKG